MNILLYLLIHSLPTMTMAISFNEIEVLQQAPPPPPSILKQTQTWLTENQDFIEIALGYEELVGPLKSFHDQSIHDPVDDIFLKKNIKRLSNNNYVFRLPNNAHYLVKISNRFNRKENIYTLYNYALHPQNPFDTAHYTYGTALTKEHYTALQSLLRDEEFDAKTTDSPITRIKNAPKTYQTVSRMAYWLICNRVIQKYQLEYLIQLPNMYLVHVPGRPTELSDRNYIIIEEEVKGLQTIEQFTQEEQSALLCFIQETGLFNCTKDNILRAPNGKIVFIDLEQPNNSNPRHFFHKAYDRYVNNSNAGLSSFKESFCK